MQIHINRDGQNYGPYSLDEARQYLASGNLIETDLAWFEGAANWMPLSQVPGIRPAARPAAAAPQAVSRAAVAPTAGAVAVDHATTHAGAAGGTTQGGFWKRVVAYVIDGVLLGVVMAILMTVLSAGSMAAGSPEAVAAALGMIGVLNLASIVGMWLYFALMESSARQATLGKMALGLVVTDLEGRRIGFGRATGRFFGKILSGLIFAIGFLMAGFTARKQGLHDMLASTLVANKDPADTRVPWWGWIVVFLFFVLPFVFGVLAAIAIPAYSDYTNRAQVAAALASAGSAKVAMAEHVMVNGRVPESLAEIGVPSVVQGAELALEDGVLVLTLAAADGRVAGGTVALEPYRAADGSIVWRCGNAQPPPGAEDIAAGDSYLSTSLGDTLLPVSCR